VSPALNRKPLFGNAVGDFRSSRRRCLRRFSKQAMEAEAAKLIGGTFAPKLNAMIPAETNAACVWFLFTACQSLDGLLN
jgi:hypothetical protein